MRAGRGAQRETSLSPTAAGVGAGALGTACLRSNHLAMVNIIFTRTSAATGGGHEDGQISKTAPSSRMGTCWPSKSLTRSHSGVTQHDRGKTGYSGKGPFLSDWTAGSWISHVPSMENGTVSSGQASS